jgi:hypothetical protein
MLELRKEGMDSIRCAQNDGSDYLTFKSDAPAELRYFPFRVSYITHTQNLFRPDCHQQTERNASGDATMTQGQLTQVYFHCANSREVRIDRSGEAVSDLTEARDRAVGIVQSLIMQRDAEDWRDWTIHVSDSNDEIFVLPFACVLGKPH